jgi:hypothetical protein
MSQQIVRGSGRGPGDRCGLQGHLSPWEVMTLTEIYGSILSIHTPVHLLFPRCNFKRP